MSEKDEQDFPLDKLHVKRKVWIDFDGANLMGEGTANLLEEIGSTGSLTEASKKLGYSYKYAWSRLIKLRDRTGIPVVITHKGGSGGGGRVDLTPWGMRLLQFYKDAEGQ